MINNNSEASPSAHSSGSQYHQYDCMALACGESGSLNIISELNGLYEDRVRNIESRTGQSTNDPLVHTLKSWVNDLNVQNTELVHALEVLERETACHVKLIEEKLKGTSIATRGYMVKAQDYNNQLQSVTSRSGQAAEDIAQIDHLKSDIRNLCRLIQQGRESENWNADDYIFFEVTLEDIFGSHPFNSKLSKPNETTSENQAKDTTEEDCGCDILRLDLEEQNKASEALQAELKKLNEEMLCKDTQLKKMALELSEFNRKKENVDGELADKNSLIGSLENDLKTMKEHMALKDEQIMSLIQKIQELREDLQEKSCTVNSLLQKASEISQDQDCHCAEEDDPAAQGDPIEILQNTLQMTDCELEQIQQDIESLLSEDLDDGTSPAQNLLVIIGEHTAIVEELNDRSKNLQNALSKARAQIRTMPERNGDRKSASQLPSSEEQQIVLDEFCKKTLKLEEELERSRAQVQSIKGELKSNEARLDSQDQNCQCSEKSPTDLVHPQNNQLFEGDSCSCRPFKQPEVSMEALKSMVEKLRADLDHMMMENSSLYEELQQKDEILRKMAKVNHERTILQRELQEELSNTTTLVQMQQHMHIIHQTTRNFQTNVTNKVKAICMKSQNSPKMVCKCNARSDGGSKDETLRQLENQIMDVKVLLTDEERLNDKYAEKIGELQLTVDSQAIEIKNWKLSMNKLQKSYDKVEQCAQEKEDAINLLKHEICELRHITNVCQCSSLSNKLQQREQQLKSLNLEVDDLKRKSNLCKCTLLNAQLHQKDSELEGLSHQISELRGKVSGCNCRSLSCHLKRKDAELNRQRREIVELRQRLAACRCASRNKAVEQDRIIKEMQVSLNKMESIIRQKDEEFEAAQNQYYEEKGDMERRLKELMNVAEEVKSSCNCNKNKTALVEAAEREATLQAKFTEHDRHLNNKIQEMHTMELQLSDEVQALNAQVLNLECELRQECCQVERLQVKNRDMQVELEDGREQILKLYEALSKAKSCLIEANDRLERNDAEIDHLRALLSSAQDEKDGCTDGKLTSMVQEMSNLKCEITRLVQLREKTNAEVASLQEAYQYLVYEFNSKSQSVVKLRSILSKVSFTDSQGMMILCSMQRGDFTPQINDAVGKKELNPHSEIKKLCRTKELMTNAINKLISDNTNLRRKLRARTLSQNNNWPLLSYPAKVLEIQRETKISSLKGSSQSSKTDESDASTLTEGTNRQDEEISNQSSYDSCEYAERSETSSQYEKS